MCVRRVGTNHDRLIPVAVGDHVDSKTEMTEAAGAANTVKVGFRRLGEIKVDDDVNSGNVDAACKKVGGDEVARRSVTELMEDAVAINLLHLGMDVETRVPKLRNALG